MFDGLRTDRKSSIGYPVIFTLRRFVFAFVSLYTIDHVFIQLWCLMFFSTIQIIYLVKVRPFQETLIHKLELFNEVCTLIIIYTMMCFSEANIYREDKRIYVDIVFLASMGLNILVHLYFLMKGSVTNIKNKIKKKCCQNNNT